MVKKLEWIEMAQLAVSSILFKIAFRQQTIYNWGQITGIRPPTAGPTSEVDHPSHTQARNGSRREVRATPSEERRAHPPTPPADVAGRVWMTWVIIRSA